MQQMYAKKLLIYKIKTNFKILVQILAFNADFYFNFVIEK